MTGGKTTYEHLRIIIDRWCDRDTISMNWKLYDGVHDVLV